MGLVRLPAYEQGLLKQQAALPLFHRATFLVGKGLLKGGRERAQFFIPSLNGVGYI